MAMSADGDRFLGIDSVSKISARNMVADREEIFSMIELGNSHVAFKAANGKYLHADAKSGLLFANSDSAGKQESFILKPIH